jgi:predicted GIY-YIG superfamily endonuclease
MGCTNNFAEYSRERSRTTRSNGHWVYAIKNLRNGRVYFGETEDPKVRKYAHESELRTHKNSKPSGWRADYAVYPPDAWVFIVLEFYQDRYDATERERGLIAAFGPLAYNDKGQRIQCECGTEFIKRGARHKYCDECACERRLESQRRYTRAHREKNNTKRRVGYAVRLRA